MPDDTSRSQASSRALWALLAAGWLARALFLTSASLWSDEAASLIVARLPLKSIFSELPRLESMPPLHFCLLHFWLRLFSNELLAMRSLSFLFAAAGLPVLWALARRLCPSRPLAALALACFASSWIHVAQDGRPYSLVLLLALADFLLAWDLAQGVSAARLAAFSAVASLGLCVHYHFGFILLGNAAFFLWRFRARPRELAPRLAGLILPALTTLALLPLARAQAAVFSSLTLLRSPIGARTFCEIAGQWLFDPAFLGLIMRPTMTVIGAGVLLLIAIDAVLARDGGEARSFALIHAAAFLIGLRTLEWSLSTALTQARYLLPLSPLFFCLLVDAVSRFRPVYRRTASCALAAVLACGCLGYYGAVERLDPRLDTLAARVRAVGGDPVIVHLHSFYYLPLRFYYLPEYRHFLLASQGRSLNASALPGGPGLIDDAQVSRLGDCLVIDPEAWIFPQRWGKATGAQLARALRVAGR